MMRTTLVVAALAAASHAAKLTVYGESADCTGAAESARGANGACVAGGGGSAKVVCVSVEASSAWVLNLYDAAGCNEADVSATLSGSGDACTDFEGGASLKVDCSVNSACFSGRSFVVLEGDKKVHLSEVNPGDKILSADEDGNLFFDKVFRITEWDDKVNSEFVRLTTEDGSVLELSENHYVHVNSLDADDMALAADVQVGDSVFTVADGQVTASAITEVKRVHAKGLYNIHTLSGRLVVNGVVASHFTNESKWTKKSLAPYWYKAVDMFSPIIGTENAKLDA